MPSTLIGGMTPKDQQEAPLPKSPGGCGAHRGTVSVMHIPELFSQQVLFIPHGLQTSDLHLPNFPSESPGYPDTLSATIVPFVHLWTQKTHIQYLYIPATVVQTEDTLVCVKW